MSATVATLAVLKGTDDELSQLVDAIVVQLKRYTRERGGYLEHVGPYSGELDSDERASEFFDRLKGRSPAVLVRISQGDYESVAVNAMTSELVQKVDILIASKHLRSFAARAHGDDQSAIDPTQDPGALRIIKDVRQALLGVQLQSQGFHRALPKKHAPIGEGRGILIVNFEWEFKLMLEDQRQPTENLYGERHGEAPGSVTARHREDSTSNLIVAEATTDE